MVKLRHPFDRPYRPSGLPLPRWQLDVENLHVDHEMFPRQRMVEIHGRHETGHFCDDKWHPFFRREHRAGLGIGRQILGTNDPFLRLVIGAEGVVRGQIHAFFFSLLHAGYRFLEVRQQFMMARHKLLTFFGMMMRDSGTVMVNSINTTAPPSLKDCPQPRPIATTEARANP